MFFPVKDLALALELVFGLFWGDWFLHGWRRDCCKTDFEALFVTGVGWGLQPPHN